MSRLKKSLSLLSDLSLTCSNEISEESFQPSLSESIKLAPQDFMKVIRQSLTREQFIEVYQKAYEYKIELEKQELEEEEKEKGKELFEKEEVQISKLKPILLQRDWTQSYNTKSQIEQEHRPPKLQGVTIPKCSKVPKIFKFLWKSFGLRGLQVVTDHKEEDSQKFIIPVILGTLGLILMFVVYFS